MSENLYNEMRLVLMFDLPMDTEKEKRVYNSFRKFLLQDGFIMLQYSVYTRFCHNTTECEKHIKRIIKHGPKSGNVRLIKITEIQFQNMILITGERTGNEKLDFYKHTIVIE